MFIKKHYLDCICFQDHLPQICFLPTANIIANHIVVKTANASCHHFEEGVQEILNHSHHTHLQWLLYHSWDHREASILS